MSWKVSTNHILIHRQGPCSMGTCNDACLLLSMQYVYSAHASLSHWRALLSTGFCIAISKYNQRLLHYYFDRNEHLGADHRRPTFHQQFVTKPVVKQVTTRYQMKDMDIIFPLIPISLLKVKCFRKTTASQSQVFFSKFSKMLEIDHFC